MRVAGCLFCVLALVSCSGGSDTATLTVFAAASLGEVLTEAERVFEDANPTIDVRLNLAGSSALREQLEAGAPADLFVPASPQILDDAISSGEVLAETVALAANSLVIAVPAANPAGVTSINDLGSPDLLVGLCAPSVPCGSLARAALAEAGVEAAPDTDEPDVRALVTKLAAGELDGGIVYTSDVAERTDLAAIALDPRFQQQTRYLIAETVRTGNPDEGRLFVDFLTSRTGQDLFRQFGFDAAGSE